MILMARKYIFRDIEMGVLTEAFIAILMVKDFSVEISHAVSAGFIKYTYLENNFHM